MRNEELRYSYVTSNDWENDEFNGEVYIKMWINKINTRKIDRFDRLVYKNEYFFYIFWKCKKVTSNSIGDKL